MPEFSCRMVGPRETDALDRIADGLFDHDVTAELWRAFRERPDHHLALAIEPAGLVIGFVSAVHYVHPDKPPQCWVNEVSTAPAYRRRGIAAALLRLVSDHATAAGCTQIWLATELDNEPARGLYRSIGARETPIVMYEL